MKNLDILSSSADTIHDETHENLNSATRVGGLFQDIVDWLKEFNRRTDGASGIPAATLDNTYLYYNLGNYSWVTISSGGGAGTPPYLPMQSLYNTNLALPSSGGAKTLLFTPGTGWSWGTSGGGGLDANAVWTLLGQASWWGKSFANITNHVISGDLKDVGKIKITKPNNLLSSYFEIEYDQLKDALKFNGSIYATGSVSSLGYSGGGGGGGTSLNSFLTQLNADNPDLTDAEGKYLYYNGLLFSMQPVSSGGGGASSLNGLSDVTIDSSLGDGQLLQYDSNHGLWVNRNSSSIVGMQSFIATSNSHLTVNGTTSTTINGTTTNTLTIGVNSNYEIPSTSDITKWNGYQSSLETLNGYFQSGSGGKVKLVYTASAKTAWGKEYLGTDGYFKDVFGTIQNLKLIKFNGTDANESSINFCWGTSGLNAATTSSINEAASGKITINGILGVANGSLYYENNNIYLNTHFRINLGENKNTLNVLVPNLYTVGDVIIRYSQSVKVLTDSNNASTFKAALTFNSQKGLILGSSEMTTNPTALYSQYFQFYVYNGEWKSSLLINDLSNLMLPYGTGIYCRNSLNNAYVNCISLTTDTTANPNIYNTLQIGGNGIKTVICSGSGTDQNINFNVGGDVRAKVTSSGVLIGQALLQWDSEKSSLKLTRADGTLANFYALGGISCLGMTANSSGTIDSATINTLTSSKLLMSDGAGGGCDISVYASAITNVVSAGDAKVFLFKSYGSSSNRYTVFNTPVIGGTIESNNSITSNWVINLDGSCIFKDFKIYTTNLEKHFLYIGSRVRIGLDFDNSSKLTVFRQTSNSWNAVAVLE